MKNFRLFILIRIFIVTLLVGLLLYYLFVEVKVLRSIYLAVFLLIAIGELVWYIERTNRDFTTFLLALLQDDFTTNFSESGKGKSFNQLYATFNKITKKFEEISSAKEVQHIYLEALVEHVRVGILSFDEKEKIHLMNQSLQRLLDRPHMAFLKNLASIDPKLPEVLREIRPNENKLLKINVNNTLLQVSIHASEFILDKKYYKLISFQNIKNELEANELDAWQKLIRVLTHEIMNSVTPITSLSGSLKQLVEHEKKTNKTYEKLSLGLNAIEVRSKGLQNFTDAYRRLTKIPVPQFTEYLVKDQFENLLELLDDELMGLDFKMSIPKDLTIKADQELMDQVFINLIKNAKEAVGKVPVPVISVYVYELEQIHFEIQDNGSGIDEDKLDQVFVPFFTTKDEGSGIGLALSRQIVRLHGGSIGIKSTGGSGTTIMVTV